MNYDEVEDYMKEIFKRRRLTNEMKDHLNTILYNVIETCESIARMETKAGVMVAYDTILMEHLAELDNFMSHIQ